MGRQTVHKLIFHCIEPVNFGIQYECNEFQSLPDKKPKVPKSMTGAFRQIKKPLRSHIASIEYDRAT